MKLRKRIAALMMAGAMICSTLPVNAWAVERTDTGGLCEHHPQHTAECGYTEGTEGTPCTHEHNEDCYTLVTECVHEHTEDCYPAESESDSTATPSDADTDEPTECSHECSEENGCIKKELDCQHEHDSECGYAPAEPGQPCTFVCEICNAQEGDEPAQEEGAQQHFTITGFEELPEAVREQSVTTGTALEALNLPETLAASGYAGTQDSGEAEALTIEGVTWTAQPDYDPATPSEYNFIPKLPEGYALAEGLELPVIVVTVLAADNALVPLAENDVPYLDSDGESQTCASATVVESNTTTWGEDDDGEHWYVVENTVKISKYITVAGNVHLILADGCYLDASNGGIYVGENQSLTIYGQSTGSNMGKLTARSDGRAAGIGGDPKAVGGTITINGGTVTASGNGGAGIGGGSEGAGGTITINGGTVTATSSYGAGIGGGSDGADGTITINGGTVTANGGYGAGIGGGDGGAGGTFSAAGNAVIIASSISDQTGKGSSWSGVIFEGNDGKVYGDSITLTTDAEIPNGKTLTIEKDKTLIIDSGVTLTIAEGATIINNGTLINNGVIQNHGTLTENGTFDGSGTTLDQPSNVQVALSSTTVDYGSTITITATIARDGTTNGLLSRRAALECVDFWQGKVGSGTKLNHDPIPLTGNEAILENLEITGEGWTPGTYTITADFGGRASDSLLENTGSATLTVNKANQTAPGAGEGYTIHYADETISANEGYEVSSDQSSPLTDNSAISPGDTLYVRKAEDAFYHASGWTSFTVPERPAVPTLKIDNAAEGVTIPSGYSYNTTSADFSGTWTQGDGSLVTVAPGASIYIYKPATNDSFKSGVQTLNAPQRASTPNVTINYAEESLSTTSGLEWTSGQGQNWENCSEDMAATAFSWDGSAEVTVQFRTAATGSSYASETVSVTIPARPQAPTGLQGQNETFAGDNDGKINGTSTQMEYKLSTDARWTPCTGNSVTDLAPGTYLVRVKATSSSFASKPATVKIATGAERTYTLNVTAPVFDPVTYDYTQPEAKTITISSTGNSDATISNVTVDSQNFVISGSGSTVTAGGSIETWMIQPSAGLDAGTYNATITVTYTGEATATAQVSFIVNPVPQKAPAAPTVKSTSSHSITLNPIATNENGAAAEYSRDNGATWQSSPEFTGLSPSTQYTFVARYQSLPNYEASPASDPVTASTSSSSGGGSSGGSSGGGSSSNNDSTIIDRPDKDDPTTPTTAETKTVKADSKGSIVITKSMVSDAISAAQADARKNGNTANGIAVVVPVEIDKTLDGVQITLKADALDKLVSSGVKRFTIDADRMADFGFTLDTLKELNRQTSGNVILKVKTTAVTSQEAKAAVGNRPAYDITLWYLKDGKETPVSLNGKAVSVALPYTPATGESTGNLYAVYVDASGKVQWLTRSSYNADQKAVIFEAQHFSVYGVGYQNPVPNFTDINGHWAKEHILFTVSRGLFSGTSETTFSPNTTLTRGMFVTALGRLAGINPADYQNGKFTDVKADAYYAPYVNWAASKGIVSGTTSTTFAPDSSITREQMAVILKNYADKMGYPIPKTLEAVTFADNAKISSWARDAVQTMQMAGVLSGKTGNQFDPKGNATRAEAATVLHRFVEVVIDPQTANGWTQNDSGEWSYYKDGGLVKGWLSDDQKWYWLDKTTGKMFSGGWKQIDGKWYYFYADGSMAVSTRVDGYEVGADGARITKA